MPQVELTACDCTPRGFDAAMIPLGMTFLALFILALLVFAAIGIDKVMGEDK